MSTEPRRRHALAVALVLTTPLPAVAQQSVEPSGFQSLPEDEEWDEHSRRQAGVSAGLKNLDIARGIELDLGGSIKERAEAFDQPFFGLAAYGGDSDAYLLHRVLLHANLRVGSHLRVFVEGEDARQIGRSPGAIATDVNRRDVSQAFVEATTSAGGGEVGVRLGRQELAFGSRRLIGLREGANIRQRFEGARGWWSRDSARVDLFSVRPVTPRPGAVDDRRDLTRTLSGIHAALARVGGSTSGIDAYYYRSTGQGTILDGGRGDERRNTFGLRWSGTADRFAFDVEAVVQRGRFGQRRISAGALFGDLSLLVAPRGWRPTIGFKANRVSGGSGLNTIGTFNPLYSRVALINEANLQTYANMTDIYPYVTIRPSRTVLVNAGIDVQWRTSITDGFYVPPVLPIFAGAANRERALGHALTAQIDWTPGPNLSVTLSAVRYDVRGFLKAAGARDTTWVGAWTTFRF